MKNCLIGEQHPMEADRHREYQEKIVTPLRKAVEAAGGMDPVARKMGTCASRLKTVLYKHNNMTLTTLMSLCDALNITLVFMDMNMAKNLQ